MNLVFLINKKVLDIEINISVYVCVSVHTYIFCLCLLGGLTSKNILAVINTPGIQILISECHSLIKGDSELEKNN